MEPYGAAALASRGRAGGGRADIRASHFMKVANSLTGNRGHAIHGAYDTYIKYPTKIDQIVVQQEVAVATILPRFLCTEVHNTHASTRTWHISRRQGSRNHLRWRRAPQRACQTRRGRHRRACSHRSASRCVCTVHSLATKIATGERSTKQQNDCSSS